LIDVNQFSLIVELLGTPSPEIFAQITSENVQFFFLSPLLKLKKKKKKRQKIMLILYHIVIQFLFPNILQDMIL